MLGYIFRSFSKKGRFQLCLHLLAMSGIAAAVISSGDACLGDFYRYVDDEGVVCFTDTPHKRGAVRIMREKKTNRRTTSPSSPSLAEIRKGQPVRSARWEKGALENVSLPVPGRVSSTVGYRHDPIDGLLRFHNGIDIAVAEGTPVKPVAPGVVYFSGNRNGYGNMVIITHEDGMITIYAHNSMNLVKNGERVGKETAIAFSGSTGRSTGPHLHFEAWKNGSNMTDEIMANAPGCSTTSLAAHRPRRDIIRSSIMADGSLLFTNIP